MKGWQRRVACIRCRTRRALRAQCGFCTPGILMSAYALLQENTAPSRDEIKDALSGNLCRCTGYTRIYEAIEQAARNERDRDPR